MSDSNYNCDRSAGQLNRLTIFWSIGGSIIELFVSSKRREKLFAMFVKKCETLCLIFNLILSVAANTRQSGPPPVFWQWNERLTNRGRSVVETPQDENYPEFLQSYYEVQHLEKFPTIMGSYRRQSPDLWSGVNLINLSLFVTGEGPNELEYMYLARLA